jgi:hypothetical protein
VFHRGFRRMSIVAVAGGTNADLNRALASIAQAEKTRENAPKFFFWNIRGREPSCGRIAACGSALPGLELGYMVVRLLVFEGQ